MAADQTGFLIAVLDNPVALVVARFVGIILRVICMDFAALTLNRINYAVLRKIIRDVLRDGTLIHRVAMSDSIGKIAPVVHTFENFVKIRITVLLAGSAFNVYRPIFDIACIMLNVNILIQSAGTAVIQYPHNAAGGLNSLNRFVHYVLVCKFCTLYIAATFATIYDVYAVLAGGCTFGKLIAFRNSVIGIVSGIGISLGIGPPLRDFAAVVGIFAPGPVFAVFGYVFFIILQSSAAFVADCERIVLFDRSVAHYGAVLVFRSEHNLFGAGYGHAAVVFPVSAFAARQIFSELGYSVAVFVRVVIGNAVVPDQIME